MFELKRKRSGQAAESMEFCKAANGGAQKVDTRPDTITSLRQKIFQLEQQLANVQQSAYHDELTGLANRRLLCDRLNQALIQADRHQNQVGLLFLDLNCFKSVNDSHGHIIGDALLVQAAKRLVGCIRASDSVYRYGGDEFVILLPGVDGPGGFTKLIRKLHARLARPYSIGNYRLVVTASIGIAVYPTDGATQHDLLRRADRAMYQAKKRQ